MYKIFLSKLTMMFVTVAVIGGVSTATFPMLNSEQTAIRKSQASNTQEDNIKDATLDSKNTNKKETDKELDSVSDEKELSDNSQNNDANKQQTSSYKQEKSSSNTNKQVATSTQSNNNVSTNKQTNTTTTSEVKTPTIYYDRTTSIYANDNITLLRVEYYKNNKLTYYSVVEQFDAETKSYIEKIYQCNRVTNINPLIRTDVYANGNLIKSY